MADTEQPQQPIEEQVTSKTPAHATKQKIQNESLRAKLPPRKQKLLARSRERLLSRHRASLRINRPSRLILHLLPTLHRTILHLLRQTKTFSQQHNG